jgi:hypothetical protein
MNLTDKLTIAALVGIASIGLSQTPTVKPVSLATTAPSTSFVVPTAQPVTASLFANDGPIKPGAKLVVVGNGWYKASPTTYEFRSAGKLIATVDCSPNGTWYAHLHAGATLVAFTTLDAAQSFIASSR